MCFVVFFFFDDDVAVACWWGFLVVDFLWGVRVIGGERGERVVS